MKEFAEQLSDCLMRKLNIDAEIAAIVEAAKEQQINVKALKRVAREMCLEPAKLAKALDDEAQLTLFRDEVDLLHRKGLHVEAISNAKTQTEASLAYLKGSRAIKEAAA